MPGRHRPRVEQPDWTVDGSPGTIGEDVDVDPVGDDPDPLRGDTPARQVPGGHPADGHHEIGGRQAKVFHGRQLAEELAIVGDGRIVVLQLDRREPIDLEDEPIAARLLVASNPIAFEDRPHLDDLEPAPLPPGREVGPEVRDPLDQVVPQRGERDVGDARNRDGVRGLVIGHRDQVQTAEGGSQGVRERLDMDRGSFGGREPVEGGVDHPVH